MVPPGGMKGGFRQGRPPMRGGSGKRLDQPAAAPYTASSGPAAGPVRAKKRILFVCIGNAARSQMAEAYARTYGSDVIVPFSGGTSPAVMVAPFAIQILGEKNIGTEGQFPKGIDLYSERFDVVVNMSGQELSIPAGRTMEWTVPDPGGQSEEAYRAAARLIEELVMRLILELRKA